MRWLYLHGFASGPDSMKGTLLARHYATRGVEVERLDLRVPSFAHLRLSAMIERVSSRVGPRTIVFGSSLGGLTAARVAERDPRVEAVVLLAPAFDLAERWRAADPASVRAWEETGWLEVDDHATKSRAKVDWGFFVDAANVDAGGQPDVRVPTLLIHGTRDTTVTIDRSHAWAATRPNVRMVEVDDGHELADSLPTIATEADRFLAPWLPR